jgi:hypothetical protein
MMGKRAASSGPEYRLLIAPKFDERRQRATTLFLLETTKYFASFRYELSVDMEVTASAVRCTVRGLKAPDLSLPAAGHARFSREFDDLRGTYDIVVEGLDGNSNSFSVRISDTKVHLIQKPARTFVDLFTDPNLWPTD